MEYEVKDYLGNVYASKTAMCKSYGVAVSTYNSRIQKGLSQKEALTLPPDNKKIPHPAYDHYGKKYESTAAMCNHYRIRVDTFRTRIQIGWSLKDALETPVDDRYRRNTGEYQNEPVYDFTNKKFSSIKNMCDYYMINRRTFESRIQMGWTLKDALTIPPSFNSNKKTILAQSCKDHLGQNFESITKMCKYWNINRRTFSMRLDTGCTLEEALTLPKNMYVGEHRVAECLKRLSIRFYHDCTIKTIFKDFNIKFNWDDFLNTLQNKLLLAGVNWSKSKIEKLRPDFILYTDNDNKICGVIEFDGKQHQNFMEFFCKTIEEFYRRSDADFVKQSLWEYLNIPMLRIRHDQIDMIDDMVKDFVNNPQNYIHNHNTYLSEDEYWSILSEEKAKLELAFAS